MLKFTFLTIQRFKFIATAIIEWAILKFQNFYKLFAKHQDQLRFFLFNLIS